MPDLSTQVTKALAEHYVALVKWNKVHNLTRITDLDEAVLKHYVDALWPLLTLPAPKKLVDLGSGTGLPGVAAAALWPQTQVVLVETVGKKCSFLRSVSAQSQTLKYKVEKARVEDLKGQEADLVVSRATFPWEKLPSFAKAHGAIGGQLLAYLGKDRPSDSQWQKVCREAGLHDAKVAAYQLPAADFQRHLAWARY